MSRKTDKQIPKPAAPAAIAPVAKPAMPVQQVPICTGCEQPLSQVKEYPGRPFTCVNRKCWKIGLLTLPIAVKTFTPAPMPSAPTATRAKAGLGQPPATNPPQVEAQGSPADGKVCEGCGATSVPLRDDVCPACYIQAMNQVGMKTGHGPQPFNQRDCARARDWPKGCKHITHDGCPAVCQGYVQGRRRKKKDR
jgi:hypothetical protein